MTRHNTGNTRAAHDLLVKLVLQKFQLLLESRFRISGRLLLQLLLATDRSILRCRCCNLLKVHGHAKDALFHVREVALAPLLEEGPD